MEHAETVKPVLDIVGMNRRLRKEILLSLMLNNERSQILHLACRADKNFTLSVLDILHDIVRYSLRHAEILHVVRNVNSQVLAKIEEMIDSMARSEDYSSMVKNRNFLLAEIFCFHRFDLNERSEYHVKSILISNIEIRRLLSLWFRLRY